MAKRRGGRSTSSNNRGSAGKTVLAFVLGAAAAAGAGYLYLRSTPPAAPTSPSVAVPQANPAGSRPAGPSPAGPSPAQAASSPPATRSAPFGTSEDVFEAGAHLYAARCSSCHGTPAKDALAKPSAQQLWRAGRAAVSARTPGNLYDQIAVGAPARGMPAYAHTLNETQIWQLALLLKNANGDLPDPVIAILGASPASTAASR